ncbi:large subunit ribosomal protein L19 [Peptoniphilus olsenii]|uniref:Large ribosomal subunit protein bL19 n=1 Tax=Peptoniphilus olsenii TaxID=411570 RepID=A0ABV2J6L7_9FIRM
MDIIRAIEEEQINKDLPDVKVGDSVSVHYKIIEGNRQRVQVFDGTVIKVQGKSSRKTFTVRRISYGIGVERTFLLNSPRIDKLVINRRGKVRRAKLFYIRERQGKSAKVKERVDY